MSQTPEQPNSPTQEAATPQNNLALRYSYEQLDAKHRDMADRITALITAYPDITRVSDPAKQRRLLELAMSPGTQGSDAVANLLNDPEVSNIVDKIPFLSGLKRSTDNAQATMNTVNGVVDAAGAGITTPLNAASAGADEFFNQLKVIANNTTPEQARSIGTAYASVFQAQAADRKAKGLGAAFTSFGNFWAEAGAVLAFAWDFVSTLGKPKHSLDEHRSRAHFKADLEATRKGLTDAKEINGVNTEGWAELLTKGGEVQNLAGHDVGAKAPTMDDPVPTLPDAPTNPDGSPFIENRDNLNAAADAATKGGNAASDAVKEGFAGIDTPLEIGAAVTGGVAATYVAADAVTGVAQGALRQVVGGRSVPVQRDAQVAKRVDGLRQQATAVREGNSGLRFWENDAGRAARAARLEQEALELETKPSNLRNAQTATSRRDVGGRLGQWADDAAEAVNGKHRFGRNAGRWVGDLFGGTVERIAHQGSRLLHSVDVLGTKLGDIPAKIGPAVDSAIKGTQQATADLTAKAGSVFNRAPQEAAAKVVAETADRAVADGAGKAATAAVDRAVGAAVAKGASKSAKGPILAVLTVFGVGAYGGYKGNEQYETDARSGRHPEQGRGEQVARGAGSELWSTVKNIFGVEDFSKGDWKRGSATVVQNLIFLPVRTELDQHRDRKNTAKLDGQPVQQIIDLVPAKAKATTGNAWKDGYNHAMGEHETGNIYLDRIMQLKEMKARGVTTVGVSTSGSNLLWSLDERVGDIRYEGSQRGFMRGLKESALALVTLGDTFKSTEMTIDQAIELNSRQYLVRGGSVDAARTAVAPIAAAQPHREAPAQSRANAQEHRLTQQELAAAHDGVREQVRAGQQQPQQNPLQSALAFAGGAKVNMGGITLADFKMPAMPKIDLPKIDLPKVDLPNWFA
jgi:hypothetical protein